MDWKLHLIFSFVLYFIIILFFWLPMDYSVAAFFLLAFSSLLPDVDYKKSVIRGVIFAMVFYLLMMFVVIQRGVALEIKILTIVILLFLVYYSYKNIPLKHRGKKSLHRWRYPFMFTGISLVLFALANINISLILFIFIGYGSHLLTDKIKEF